ncbi:hypothetical protein PFISCL1PPCAC_22167, partial [Pristionchus fissidentatus]
DTIGDPIGNCPKNDRCVQPLLNNAEITCSSGALEARYHPNGVWFSVARVDCTANLADTFLSDGNEIFERAVHVQCRIERGCKMPLYTSTLECGIEQNCVAPDASSYTCPLNMQLEAKFTDDGRFEAINKVKCNWSRFIVLSTGNNEDNRIPLQFRCSKLREACTARNPLVSQCN